MNVKSLYALCREAVVAWVDDYAPSMGAAISYYTMFSLAPLLVIVIAIAGLLFGRDAVQARVLAEAFGRMPWHNVMYFPGAFGEVAAAVRAK